LPAPSTPQTARAPHGGDDLARGEEGAVDVDRHPAPELLEADLDQAAAADDGGVVDQHLGIAELTADRGEDGVHLGRIDGVAWEGVRVHAQGGKLAHVSLHLIGATGDEGDGVAAGAEPAGQPRTQGVAHADDYADRLAHGVLP
jgi:hypothetical protein